MKLNAILALLVVAALLLAGCGAGEQGGAESGGGSSGVADEPETLAPAGEPAPLTPENLEELLAYTNRYRHGIRKPEPKDSFYLEWVTGEPASLSWTNNEKVFSEEDVYSLEEAASDVERLFLWYENVYGPYFHFGGKAAFDRARDAVLADLEALETITGEAFQQTILTHLSFIEDGHLRINWLPTNSMIMGFVSEATFLEDTAGFCDTLQGRRVVSIDGDADYAEHMVLSLSEAGELVYRYLILAPELPESPLIEYDDGSQEVSSLIDSHDRGGSPAESEDPVWLEHHGDIPVITVKTMGFDQSRENDRGATLFLQYAEELRDAPVLIVDLRDNGGGNGLLPKKWMERYTGEVMATNFYEIRRYDFYPALGLVEQAALADDSNPNYNPPEEVERYLAPRRLNDSWGIENEEPRQVVPSDRLLIVLTNKNTGSAADMFTDLAFNLENALVIGSNTTGVMVSNAFTGEKLPNTGLVAQLGNTLCVFDQAYFQEFVGLLPDLWVTGDALETALALAERR